MVCEDLPPGGGGGDYEIEYYDCNIWTMNDAYTTGRGIGASGPFIPEGYVIVDVDASVISYDYGDWGERETEYAVTHRYRYCKIRVVPA